MLLCIYELVCYSAFLLFAADQRFLELFFFAYNSCLLNKCILSQYNELKDTKKKVELEMILCGPFTLNTLLQVTHGHLIRC